MVFMHSYTPMFLTQPSVWPLYVPGTCSWSSLEPSSESSYKCPLPLQSFFRKERIVLISAPFFPSRLTFNSVPSHLHNRRIVTYPLARRPIAQYCSISCWHFFKIFLQFASSDWSPQSLSPLQRSLRFTHLPGRRKGVTHSPVAAKRGTKMVWAPTMCQTFSWTFKAILISPCVSGWVSNGINSIPPPPPAKKPVLHF